MLIRRAVEGDLPGIERAQAESIRGLAGGHYAREQIEAWARLRSPTDPPARADLDGLYVAEVDGEVVAFGHMRRRTGELAALYVRPAHARQGIGTRLLAALEEDARQAAVTWVHLSASMNAAPFYAKAGYAERGRTEHTFRDGSTIPCVEMEKALG